MLLRVKMIIINEFGEFVGKDNIINDEQYKNLIELSSNFYKADGFELTTEDDSFIMIPPNIVQKSILKITKEEINEKK